MATRDLAVSYTRLVECILLALVLLRPPAVTMWDGGGGWTEPPPVERPPTMAADRAQESGEGRGKGGGDLVIGFE